MKTLLPCLLGFFFICTIHCRADFENIGTLGDPLLDYAASQPEIISTLRSYFQTPELLDDFTAAHQAFKNSVTGQTFEAFFAEYLQNHPEFESELIDALAKYKYPELFNDLREELGNQYGTQINDMENYYQDALQQQASGYEDILNTQAQQLAQAGQDGGNTNPEKQDPMQQMLMSMIMQMVMGGMGGGGGGGMMGGM